MSKPSKSSPSSAQNFPVGCPVTPHTCNSVYTPKPFDRHLCVDTVLPSGSMYMSEVGIRRTVVSSMNISLSPRCENTQLSSDIVLSVIVIMFGEFVSVEVVMVYVGVYPNSCPDAIMLSEDVRNETMYLFSVKAVRLYAQNVFLKSRSIIENVICDLYFPSSYFSEKENEPLLNCTLLNVIMPSVASLVNSEPSEVM